MAEEKSLSVQQKIALQQHVQAINFVESVDKLLLVECKSCNSVAIGHHSLNCGHTVCINCFAQCFLKCCPVASCNKVVTYCFEDKRHDDIVKTLKAFCKFRVQGCEAVVSLPDLIGHEKECKFSPESNLDLRTETNILNMNHFDLILQDYSQNKGSLNLAGVNDKNFSVTSLTLNWEIPTVLISSTSDQRLHFQSNVFYLIQYGCRVRFHFHLKPQILFKVQVLDRQVDNSFPLKGHCRYTFIIRHQSANESKHDFIRTFEPGFGDWLQESMYCICLTPERLALLYSTWLKDKKTRIEIIVEPLDYLLSSEPLHYGSLTWTINNYKTVRNSYHFGRQYSLSENIYSAAKGYRMKALMWIGEQVEIVIYFLKGQWDQDLPKKFSHRTTITFINQDDTCALKNKEISIENWSLTFDSFFGIISENDLEKFVFNDTLTIHIKVEQL